MCNIVHCGLSLSSVGTALGSNIVRTKQSKKQKRKMKKTESFSRRYPNGFQAIPIQMNVKQIRTAQIAIHQEKKISLKLKIRRTKKIKAKKWKKMILQRERCKGCMWDCETGPPMVQSRCKRWSMFNMFVFSTRNQTFVLMCCLNSMQCCAWFSSLVFCLFLAFFFFSTRVQCTSFYVGPFHSIAFV